MPARPKPPEQTTSQAPAAELEPSSSSSSNAELSFTPSPAPAYPNSELLEAEIAKLRGRVHDLERSDERTAAQLTELWATHAELSHNVETAINAMRETLERLVQAVEASGKLPAAGG